MDFPEEFSCYNDTITSLTEAKDLQEKQFAKIRVLHCANLTSMQGIEDQTNLIDLNLSSNAIQRIESLHKMSSLIILNLSCNNIRVINCLSGLKSLQKLNLSFNKISSIYNLRQLYGPEYSNFTVFDIRGNNISLTSELKFLTGCQFLTDVAFQGQTGTNPVCKQLDYYYTVVNALPGLKFVDHQPVNLQNKDVVSPKVINQSVRDSPKREKPTQELKSIQEDSKENSLVKEDTKALKDENTKLHQDLDELYTAYKELSYKYRHSEEYWATSTKKLEDSLTTMQYERKDIENECRRLRKKLSKKENKIHNLKSKTATVIADTGTKERAYEDIHQQIANLMKDLGESQRMSQQALDEVYKKQEKIKLLEKKNYEQKAEIKRFETLVNQLHTRSLESSQSALQKYEELQKKYEDLQGILEEKGAEIDVLKRKNMEILDLNAKFDENWSAKYREAVHLRENTISSLREEVHRLTLAEKERTQQIAYTEKEEVRNKIWELEQKIINQTNEYKDKDRDTENRFIDITRENSDLKEMLKLSIEKEAKSKDFISELTELVKQLQVQLDKEIAEKTQIRKQNEEKMINLESEANSFRAKNEALKSRIEIIEKDAALHEDDLHIKNREVARLKRQLEDKNIVIEDFEEKIKGFRNKAEKSERNYNNELEELQEQVKELELSLGTKNVIIEDQGESIKELKSLLNQYEQEIEQYQSSKNSYKDSYETKLQDAYDEIETLKNKLTQTENMINDIEGQILDLNSKKNEYKDLNTQLQKQIQEKNEVLEYVESEIVNMKKEKDEELKEVTESKDGIISDLKNLRDTLTTKLMSQEKELKEKTAKNIELQRDLELMVQELQSERKKIKEMEQEIRALLLEMDNQKKLAAEKVSQLSKLFA
ncbi:hypothetical protein SteCoe_19617 [Stentor coeruleus]|uniref:U2A'/phosphoprotein 32 family A C-terminal domain-containing protein n=1 Tax=Stentor coeruleus TaxID=5963 RepID=A0A1R2BTX7_9CILI|nr:hypothetical protein SteCoe_19617 [Stentor coeruleus]